MPCLIFLQCIGNNFISLAAHISVTFTPNPTFISMWGFFSVLFFLKHLFACTCAPIYAHSQAITVSKHRQHRDSGIRSLDSGLSNSNDNLRKFYDIPRHSIPVGSQRSPSFYGPSCEGGLDFMKECSAQQDGSDFHYASSRGATPVVVAKIAAQNLWQQRQSFRAH